LLWVIRRLRLKIPRWQHRDGSIPFPAPFLNGANKPHKSIQTKTADAELGYVQATLLFTSF